MRDAIGMTQIMLDASGRPSRRIAGGWDAREDAVSSVDIAFINL